MTPNSMKNWLYPIFEHLQSEHNLTLTDDELYQIFVKSKEAEENRIEVIDPDNDKEEFQMLFHALKEFGYANFFLYHFITALPSLCDKQLPSISKIKKFCRKNNITYLIDKPRRMIYFTTIKHKE